MNVGGVRLSDEQICECSMFIQKEKKKRAEDREVKTLQLFENNYDDQLYKMMVKS